MNRKEFIRQSTAFAAASVFLPACAEAKSKQEGGAPMPMKVK